MCGICCIIDFKGSAIDEGLISVMLASLSHRGPGGEGVFINQGSGVKGQAALGHRRLSIIDLKTGDQPMFNENKSIAVVYNGEIYNFNEFKKDLIKRGHRFKTKSDTEVILHQYEEDGWECAKRFNGIFAFALWDDNKKTLLLARDRIGIKPLYYFYDKERFMFASEIKAILKVFSERPEINPSSLFRYLILQYIPAPDTLYKNIYKLLPANVILANRNGIEIKQYWGFKEARSQKSEVRSNDPNDEEAISKKLLKTIDESINSQLISDVPLGAFLSGGIDSSAIVAYMSKRMKDSVKTFSVGFDTADPYYNELSYARIASKYFKTEHHEIIVRPQDVVNIFPVIARHLDDPINDPAVLPTYMVSKLAKEHVKVVLSGEGADELFGDPVFIEDEWSKLRAFFRLIHDEYNPPFPPLAKGGVGGFESDSILYTDIKTWLPDDLLIKVDTMSMAHGLEARVPYLDNRIVDFALSIPSWLKIKGFKRTYIFKKAVSNILPDEIVSRSKRGFELPISHWFRNELKDFVLERLSDDSVRRMGFFYPSSVNKIIKEHINGNEDNSLQIWGLLTLQFLLEENKR